MQNGSLSAVAAVFLHKSHGQCIKYTCIYIYTTDSSQMTETEQTELSGKKINEKLVTALILEVPRARLRSVFFFSFFFICRSVETNIQDIVSINAHITDNNEFKFEHSINAKR